MAPPQDEFELINWIDAFLPQNHRSKYIQFRGVLKITKLFLIKKRPFIFTFVIWPQLEFFRKNSILRNDLEWPLVSFYGPWNFYHEKKLNISTPSCFAVDCHASEIDFIILMKNSFSDTFFLITSEPRNQIKS